MHIIIIILLIANLIALFILARFLDNWGGLLADLIRKNRTNTTEEFTNEEN